MSKRLSSNIDDTITRLNKSKNYLENAFENITKAKEKIDNGTWEGKAQIETAVLIDLCMKYHEDINGFIKENIESIKSLKENADNFMENSNYAKSWKE